MKRLMYGAVALALLAPAAYAAPKVEEVAVGLTVPQQCYAQARGGITGTVTINPQTLQPTGFTFNPSTVTVNCNVASSTLSLSHTDLSAQSPTDNPQFTNTIRIGVWLGGDGSQGFSGGREGDTTGATWSTGLQVPGNPRPNTFAYGRYRMDQPIYVTGWEVDAGKALVAGGYVGTVTVTMQPDELN